MSGFSAEWLALREGADQRARNRDVAIALSAWFALREHVSVLDLGSGTGANLRAVVPLLPARQTWIMIDHDAALFLSARAALVRWADRASETGDGLALEKDGTRIAVQFVTRDLARNASQLVGTEVDLVTASALFDLTSPGYIKALARATAQRRAAFYGVLTYNGLQKWVPHRPPDNQIAAAFNRHQMSDKGFGPAAGPLAPAHLADEFRLEGYSVLEGESPWRLGAGDRMLLAELQRGHAMAALETRSIDAKTVEMWVKVIRSGAEIGHTDIFAVPGAPRDA